MPRKMKKLEAMEAMPSRQESVPGPAPRKKGAQLETFQKSFQKKYDAAFAKFEDAEELYKMEPTEENATVLESARMEAERQRVRLQKTENRQEEYDQDTAAYNEKQMFDIAPPTEAEMAAKIVGRMDAQVQSERRVKKSKQEAELQGMVGELIAESGVKIPEEQSKVDARKEMEDLDKEWADRIKSDIAEAEGNMDKPMKSREAVVGPTPEQVQMTKAREMANSAKDRAEAGERIRANVQAERASAEMDPARKRSIAKLKKLEAEHAATGQRLQDLTGMSPEDAYEKLVLNGGFMQRMRRGLAKLANVPTYDLLDSWVASGKKMEEVDREVMGTEPDFGHEMRAKGLRNRADEGMATEAAIGREDARAYRKAKQMESMETAEEEIPVEVMAPISAEDLAIADMEADFKRGIVRDAEGGIIDDEKKIRAKRPMSRVPGRKVSMGQAGIVDAMAKAERVQMHQPGEEAEVVPKMRKAKVEAPVSEENEMLKFQKERAADINVVRKEYPRAAEVWNSIATRLQGLEKGELDALKEVFGTRDLATAYVLDRAFYDMDGDQQAKARIDQADKLLGIEEVSPKKVRPKVSKKAA